MNKKIFGLLGLVVAVGLIGAGCSRYEPADSSTSVVPAPGFEGTVDEMIVNDGEMVLVTYTDSGFSPKSVTIDAGDTIRFMNESSGTFWPAAKPHPFHTSVPGFDAKRAISAGSSYEFTFTKTGTFGYHNHPYSSISGTVIVR